MPTEYKTRKREFQVLTRQKEWIAKSKKVVNLK